MKQQTLLAIVGAVGLGLFFSLPSDFLRAENPAAETLAHTEDTSSAVRLDTITLGKPVHFLAPDGSDVLISPGDYEVQAAEGALRLVPAGGQASLVIQATATTHEEGIGAPTALIVAEERDEKADILHVVLLLPGGKSLDAPGSYSGVRTRGLRERLAERPLINKARQAKEAVQERIHDRLFGAPPPTTTGPNAFNSVFNESAVGYSQPNAYLLTYLTTLIYPDYLDQMSGDPLKQDEGYVKGLHMNPQAFVQEYAKYTHHLFWNAGLPAGPTNVPPLYVWVLGNRGGQDPEAMVISTPKAVFAVFRGTDRVASAKRKVGYTWAEWIQTDFAAYGIPPDLRTLTGRVHKGFWESLTAPATPFVPNDHQSPMIDEDPRKIVEWQMALRVALARSNGMPFREALLALIKALGGDRKRVWIVGHSLGAAHAQLYGAYLSANGVSPQGVYAIAAPHVGDQDFVNVLNSMFPNQRLQRFDFIDDPVTKVPPSAPLPQDPGKPPIAYARAGTRVYYDDVKTAQFAAPERSPAEAAALAARLIAPIPLSRVMVAGDFCYHYPHWYLAAAYYQLNPTVSPNVPSPLMTPVMRGDIYSRLCGPVHIFRGNRRPGTLIGR